jgi:hypothetical protein
MKRLTALAAVLTLTAGSAALAASGPGKFQTKLTGNGAKTMHGKLDGTWTINLSSPTAGHVQLTWNGEQTGGGRYAISGSTITLTPKRGGGCHTKGKYTFKRTGDGLTFTPISDTCTVRRDVLTFGAWTAVS